MTARGDAQWCMLLIAGVVFSGCARTAPLAPADSALPPEFPEHSVQEIEDLIRRSTDTLESFRARASLTVNSPERSGRYSAEIRERRGDSLYISISPGLGIEAARILVTEDSIFVYDRLQNTVLFGSAEEGSSVLPIPLEGEALFRNVTGQVVPRIDADWTVSSDATRYYLSNPSRTEAYAVDPSLWRVVRYTRQTEDGQLLEERRFEDFVNVDGHHLPRRLVFRQPLDDASVILTYREIEANPSALSFDLRVRTGATWTPVSTR